jgi:dihydroxyacetone kinase-like predicted kinase
VESVLAQVIAAAADSVQRTPQLLRVLEDAGVVDSGGQGLYRLFEGMIHVDGTGRVSHGATVDLDVEGHVLTSAPLAVAGYAAATAHAHAMEAGQHGYETEFLVAAADRPIDVAALRVAITAVGDSVVVAGDASLVRVHVHGDRPDQAIAIGIAWGRLSSVSVRDLDDQVAHNDAPQRAATAPLPSANADPTARIAIVAISHADGLARVLESLAAHVVRPAHGTRPSVGELRAAIEATGRQRVIVLPNDRDAFLAARQAAELVRPIEVAIVPSRNAAEGIAAAVAYDEEATFEESVARMGTDAAGLRSFTVIRAARDAVVDDIAVSRGRILAFDAERHLLAHGDRLDVVVLEALSQLGEVELVTCYHGEHVTGDEAGIVRTAIAGWDQDVEVELVPGGQRHDLLLVAVE